MIRILFLGDVVGRPGRRLLKSLLPSLKAEFDVDFVIANGENSAGGLGVEAKTASEILSAGVDLITTGNHIWNKKEIFSYLDSGASKLIRPINYPPGVPGAGYALCELTSGQEILVINALGRVFIPDLLDCPFRALDRLLSDFEDGPVLKLLDFHAEATSEKLAMAHHLDGRLSAMVGTHTHVQTADERILPAGTAYISDVGMCGPREGIIGMREKEVLERFLRSLPNRLQVAKGGVILNAVVISCDEDSGKALDIERIYRRG